LKIDAERLSGHVRVCSWKAGCVRSRMSVGGPPVGERGNGVLRTILAADLDHLPSPSPPPPPNPVQRPQNEVRQPIR
jgi:hypothetical protein